MTGSGIRRVIAGAVVGVVAMAAAGCGSDEGEGGGAGSGQAASGGGSVIETARANVAKSEQGGAFPKLPAAYDPGTGKVAIIACIIAGTDCERAANASAEAAKAVGWETKIFDAKFSPQRGSAFIEEAVQEGYDGVISIAMPVEGMKAAVDNATANDVAVTCMGCLKQPDFDDVHYQSVDWASQGDQLAWYIIDRSKGKAKALVYDDPSVPAVGLRVAQFKKTIAQCSDCEVEYAKISTTEIGKPGPPTFTADLSERPSGTLTDVVDPYDAIGYPMAKTLQAQGRADVTVSGYDSTPEMITAMTAPDDVKVGGSMGFPWGYAAWASMDAVARQKAGAPELDASKLPTVLITKNNASKFAEDYFGPPDYMAQFQSTWGQN